MRARYACTARSAWTCSRSRSPCHGGIDIGDVFGHVPLPAKITIEVLEPIDVRGRFGDDVEAAYDTITGVMQRALDRLAAERRLLVLG